MDDILHVHEFLKLDEQKQILQFAREVTPGFYEPTTKFGGKMSIKMNSLGWHWNAKTYKYEKNRTDADGLPCAAIPDWLNAVGRRALDESGYWPKDQLKDFDIILMNFYPEATGKLGVHQDNSESKESLATGYPVLSFSIGAIAAFIIGGLSRKDPMQEISLKSGDVIIFGRSKRLAFHGVKGLTEGSTPADLDMKAPGRLNLTFRII